MAYCHHRSQRQRDKVTGSFPKNDQTHAAISKHFATSVLACKTQASNHPINTGLYTIINHASRGIQVTLLPLVTSGIDGYGAIEVEAFVATTSNTAAWQRL